MKFNFCTQVFQTGESIPIRTLIICIITSFFNKILFIFCWYLWFFIFMLLFLFFFYATFIFFSYLYIFQFKNSIFWCKKKSLFMLENKTKEMYLFSQNVSRIFFILSKITLGGWKRCKQKTAIFDRIFELIITWIH